ncbi:VWA domain containing CoxE-like protein [Planctomycetes bacterium Pan216]|uniref:VWA domain containing CoxE-like protein n=1 Tax=Kolteria novifilia TaxID=2527975 RepID=A0A518B348_9BACT|nr:VWA domain containing CoxE-like protein [Planctomycetes bacterium Pan216]
MSASEETRLERWRLILGQDAEQSCGGLQGEVLEMDRVLQSLYGAEGRGAGLGGSAPKVNRWLGDIRKFFPKSVVRVMQQDAFDRLGLAEMLLQPELLESVEPDVHLVATLLSLGKVIPQKTKETARAVVRSVVRQVESRLKNSLIQAVRGSLNRSARTSRPRPNEIDWDRTIRKNLKNYLPEKRTIIAEQLVGWGRKRSSLRDIILCVDQSGSMATSVVYSGIFGAVLASIRAVRTRMVVFDTEVADLTDEMDDPVDLLFGAQLGGGTDINRAVAYCQQHVTRPSKTIMVLITDLYEGGDERQMLSRIAALVASGVNVICLLALSDDGTPMFDEGNAHQLAELGVPSFGCTPDQFPELIATAISRQDIGQWAARNNVVLAGGNIDS